MVLDFDKWARIDWELESPEIPEWQFEGFFFPYDLVVKSWRAYRDNGILLVEGGYLDQPAEWWADMETCRALFNTRHEQNREEGEAKMRSRARA